MVTVPAPINRRLSVPERRRVYSSDDFLVNKFVSLTSVFTIR